MPVLKLSYKKISVSLLGWLVLLPKLLSTQSFYLVFPTSCFLQLFKSLPPSSPALELFPAPFPPVSSLAPYSRALPHTEPPCAHNPLLPEFNALFLSADLPGLDCPHLDNLHLYLHSCISLHLGWHCSQEVPVSAMELELLHALS